MSAYRLVENAFRAEATGHAPAGAGLFHGAAFHRLHADRAGVFLEWLDAERVVATVHFTEVEPGHWRSPARGTFGGFAFEPELTPDALTALVECTEGVLRHRGARRVTVLPAPMAHRPAAFANQVHALHARGFEVQRIDLNQSLRVDERPLSGRMSYGNRKRLAKCGRDGYRCQPVGLGELPAVYETISANRASKGHAMSMSLGQLQDLQARCAEPLRLFACHADHQMVAAAVCLQLDPDLLYVFYWGDRPGQGSHSPVVAIADEVYRYCQSHGIGLLDVGTSTVDREQNAGLLQFKRGLGFEESLKLWMGKAL
jgi:hypothetical protein